ncbi:hypothetical protein EII17_01885 [Clostridiales bacterium COT073_COT-073]|nr:hypothetical protein EII17_01885 [Clostridiales bacterium COT073_COT-073]
MKGENILYIVEGETEKRFIDVLKQHYIISGKVIVYDLIKKQLTLNNLFLRTISSNTTVIIVFDTDVDQEQSVQRLSQNLLLLKTKIKHIKDVILIPQIANLEGELIYSTNIKKIQDLIGCKSEKDFKKKFLKIQDHYLMNRLKEVNFQLSKIWSRAPKNKYKIFQNQSSKIKNKKLSN